MPWVKDRRKIGQARGCIRCCKDNFEYFDLTGWPAVRVLPRPIRILRTFYRRASWARPVPIEIWQRDVTAEYESAMQSFPVR
jgi:hypothetical protein